MTSETFDPAEPAPPAFSDDALALAFAARHADRLRWVCGSGFNCWLVLADGSWTRDRTFAVVGLVRAFCREAAAECAGDDATRRGLTSSQTISGVERLARTDPRLVRTAEQATSALGGRGP